MDDNNGGRWNAVVKADRADGAGDPFSRRRAATASLDAQGKPLEGGFHLVFCLKMEIIVGTQKREVGCLPYE